MVDCDANEVINIKEAMISYGDYCHHNKCSPDYPKPQSTGSKYLYSHLHGSPLQYF